MARVPASLLPPEVLDVSKLTMHKRAMRLPPHGRTKYRQQVTLLRGFFKRARNVGIARLLSISDEEWKAKGGE